jgi:hypothetical protein
VRISTYLSLGAIAAVAVLVASLAAAFIAVPTATFSASPPGASPLVVGSCTITIHKENAQNDIVQRAITAFGPTSTVASPITICLDAGSFPEQLTISNTTDLTIRGAGNASTLLAPTAVASNGADLDNPATAVDAIVGAWNNTDLTISGVGINGSAAAPALYNNCAPTYLGVYFGNTSGTLSNSTILGINTDGGCQGQVAALANTGYFSHGNVYPTTVAFWNNTVAGFGKGGIVCRGLGLTCDVMGNTVATSPQALGFAATNGIEFWGVAGAIRSNTVTGNDYLPGACLAQNYFNTGVSCVSPYWSGGILVLSSPSDVNVSQNVLANNQVGIWSIGGPTTAWGNTFPVSAVGYYAVVLDFNPADAFGIYAAGPFTGTASDNSIAGQNVGVLAYDDNATIDGNSFASVNVSIEVATDSSSPTTTSVIDNTGTVNVSGALLGDIASFQTGDTAAPTGTYTVAGNTFTNVSSAAVDGLLVFGAQATVTDNTLAGFPNGVAVVLEPTGTLTASGNEVTAPATVVPGSGFYAFAGNASIRSNSISGYSYMTGPGWWPDSQASGLFVQCYEVCDLNGNDLSGDAIGIAVLSYVYGPFPAPSWPLAAPPSQGPINVSQNDVTDAGAFGIAFELNQATVTETGAPAVSVWGNTVDNTLSGSVGLMVDQGTYAIAQNTFIGTTAVGLSGASQPTGVGTIDTASVQVLDAYDSVTNACFAFNQYVDTSLFVALLNLTSDPPFYASTCGSAPVTFSETGLPASTPWGVTVDARSYSTTASSFTVDLPGGAAPFTVAPEAGYSVSPPSGTLTVAGSALALAIVFAVPALAVSPGQGPEGATVIVSGSGFTESTALASLEFDAVPIGSCLAGSLTTDGTGAFSCTVAVPAGTSGDSVVATDVSGTTASATFAVTSTAITVAPGQGPVGATVTVSGTGFSVSSSLSSLVFDGVTIAACTAGSLATDSGGAFSCTFAVPSGTSGSTVTATDPGGQSASGTFLVTTPAIGVAPGQGPVGSTVVVSGTGFSVSSPVAVTFDGVAGPACASGSFTTDAGGAFSCTMAVPSGTAGTTVQGVDTGGSSATGSFTVTTVAIAVAPGQGPVGASVTVSGTGYSVLTPLASLVFDGQSVGSCSSGSLTTDASGAFSCTFAVPTGTSGTTVTATDAGGQSATSAFTVTPLLVSVSPTHGPLGATVVVTGSGFSVSSTVALVFDQVSIGSCASGSLVASPTGSFSCTITVPSGTSGTTVQATDVGGSFATTSFTVTVPRIAVTPRQGPVGATVTVSGSGFSASSPVTLVFDSVAITSCPRGGGLTTLAAGSFSCSFTVPTGTSGTVVRATDVGGRTASSTFRVTHPSISVTPHSGVVGSTVTVRGSGFSVRRTVGLVFDNVAISSCTSGSLTTAVNGTFSCSFLVPSGTAGTTVTATDVGGQYATQSFTVT